MEEERGKEHKFLTSSTNFPSDQKIYGYVCEMQENSWGIINGENYVASLSQEHGIVKASSDFFHRIQIGDLVAVLPAHSCLATNLMKDDLMIV